MNATELDDLIEVADLCDLTERRMLADAMSDAGRDDEANLLREGGEVISADGRIVKVISQAFLEQSVEEYADRHDVNMEEVAVVRAYYEGSVIGFVLSHDVDGVSKGCDETYGEFGR